MGGATVRLPAVIRIRIDRSEPLVGAATIEDGRTLAFEGWMELIRVVAALLGSTDAPSVNDSHAGGG